MRGIFKMFVPLSSAAFLYLVACGAVAQTATGVRLIDQQTQLVSLASESLSSNIYFDLPAGVTRFKVDLVGAPGSSDIDIFLRQTQDFPTQNSFDQPLSDVEISEYAQFWSISGISTESILVSAASNRPPSAGRYYLAVINYGATTSATLKLTFNPPVTPTQIRVVFDTPFQCAPQDAECECDLRPWSDSSTAGFIAPGNAGVTLGEKRKNAVIAAAQSLANQINSESPIVVRACWSAKLKTEETRAVLAAAGPDGFLANSPQKGRLPFLSPSHTFFALAPAIRAAGTQPCQMLGGACVVQPQITIFFNSLIDTPQGLGESNFYYGTSGTAPSRDIDFASVATHELTHGLGYVDLIDANGAETVGIDDAFTRNLINGSVTPPKSLARLTNAERLAAITSGNVQWVGAQTLARSSPRVLPGELGIRMYAPSTQESGSSISHLDSATFSQELMAPNYSRGNRNLGVALGQLYDIGFSVAPRAAPVKQKFYAGNWFDPARSGHGFDLEPAGNVGGYDRMFVTTYSYDAQGLPEYFISLGKIVDGTFIADSQALSGQSSTSLARYRQVNGTTQLATDFSGSLRIDFNDAASSEPCSKGNQAEGNAVLRLKAGTEVASDWCIQPLIDRAQRPAQDFTGHWFNEADPGWGMGIANALVNGKIVLLVIIYYPDAAGTFRWAYAQSDDFQNGQEITVFQRNGYCRTCVRGELTDFPAGKLKISLAGVEGSTGQANRASFNVTFQGPAGGTFSRNDVPLVRLVEPPRELQ
jgi:hypothetical protein